MTILKLNSVNRVSEYTVFILCDELCKDNNHNSMKIFVGKPNSKKSKQFCPKSPFFMVFKKQYCKSEKYCCFRQKLEVILFYISAVYTCIKNESFSHIPVFRWKLLGNYP